MHGFVKEMPWQVDTRRAGDDGAELTLSLVDTAVTRESYPFGFRLEVSYRLYAGTLTIAYTVRADSDNSAAMPFSIGNHITFRAPLVEGSDPGQLLFESPSSVEYLKDPPGLPTGESRPLSYADPVRLSEIPNRTAVSLGDYEGTPYMVLTDPQGLAIRMSHSAASVPKEPVILYNVWSDLPDGLFSPEPWVGLQNSLNLQQGLVLLPPGEDWTWSVEIHPEEAPANR